jgi:hypothetical protein
VDDDVLLDAVGRGVALDRERLAAEASARNA